MNMSVSATWFAGPWFQAAGRYIRNVFVDLDIYLYTEDNWDFTWHDGDSFWTTLTHEFAPELVAEMYSAFFGSHTSGDPFHMVGDAFTFYNYSFLQCE